MSFTPFGINVAQLVGNAWSGKAVACVLTKYTNHARTSGQSSAGTNQTPTPYNAQGFISKRKREAQAAAPSGGSGTAGIARAATTEIVLFGALIDSGAIPEDNDTIAMEGVNYRIMTVDSDGTGATYVCTCRG